MTNNAQKALRGTMTEVLLEVLPGMFQEQEKRFDKNLDERFFVQEKRFDQKLLEQFGAQESRFDQKLDDLKVNLRDEIHSTVRASEAGLIRRMDAMEELLTKRMDSGFETVFEVIDDGIIPDIKEHAQDIQGIKRHLKLA